MCPHKSTVKSLAGRIGAHSLHAKHDPRITTARGRAAFLAKFEAEVDPDGTLPPQERARRAEHARKAYFARLALRRWHSRKSNEREGRRDDRS